MTALTARALAKAFVDAVRKDYDDSRHGFGFYPYAGSDKDADGGYDLENIGLDGTADVLAIMGEALTAIRASREPLVDDRLREAAAMILMPEPPCELTAWAEQCQEACFVGPAELTTDRAMVGDYVGRLQRAKALIEEVLALKLDANLNADGGGAERGEPGGGHENAV